MDKVNVLVAARLNLYPGYLEDIAAVDERISVKDGLASFVKDLRRRGKEGAYIDRLEKQAALGGYWQKVAAQEDLDTLLAEAEVIFGTIVFPDDLLLRAPRLKWVHIANVGVERYLATDMFKGNMTVTNSRGALAIPIAEHVLTFMCMLAKNASRILSNQQNERWERFVTMELRDRVVGILGLGAIGNEVARLARGIGMKVIATRRSTTKRERSVLGVDEIFPLKDLPQMLGESDFVVIAAPLTAETRGMVSEAELRAMKPTSSIINIARGAIIDQAALVKALKEGWIAGAGLDVVETEPLPPGNELWRMPNVIISPHMAGSSDGRPRRLVDLFCENLKRYLAGEKLVNVIDPKKAY